MIKSNDDFLDRLFLLNQHHLYDYESRHGIRHFYRNHAIYIITDIGYWKIVPSNTEENAVMLMHGNNCQLIETDFHIKEVIDSKYHIQTDVKSQGLVKILDYIIAHDKNKGNDNSSYKDMPKATYYLKNWRKTNELRRLQCKS